jgi:hypothetical protein
MIVSDEEPMERIPLHWRLIGLIVALAITSGAVFAMWGEKQQPDVDPGIWRQCWGEAGAKYLMCGERRDSSRGP